MSGTARVALIVFGILVVMTWVAVVAERTERNPDFCNLDEVCP